MSTPLPWHQIDTVLLDMDGTLIDLHFDSHLWQTLVPVRYAERLGLPLAEAKAQIDTHYHAVNGTSTGTAWITGPGRSGSTSAPSNRRSWRRSSGAPTSFPSWPHSKAAGKQVVLFTNAHPASLSVKDARLGLAQHLDLMVSTHELGWSKESQHCWQALAERLAFDPARTLFVDDSERILAASAEFGIAHQLGIRHPDSQMPPLTFQHFPALDDYADLLPLGA